MQSDLTRTEGLTTYSRLTKVVLALAFAFIAFWTLCSGAATQAKQVTTAAKQQAVSSLLPLTVENDCDTAENMAPNCSFEDPKPGDDSLPDEWMYDHDTWNNPTADFIWFPVLAYSGQQSIAIFGEEPGSTARWRTSINITATADTRYYFSGRVWARNLSDRAHLAITFWDANKNFIGWGHSENVVDDTDTWEEIDGSAVAPPGTRWIRFETRLYGSGFVWFDNVFLSNVESASILDASLKDNPDPVGAGDKLTYTVVVTNVGNLQEDTWTVTLFLDNYLTVSSVIPPTSSAESNVLVWNNTTLSPLPPDMSETITVVTTVTFPLTNDTSLESVVEIYSEKARSDMVTEHTKVHSAPDLELKKLAPLTIAAGSPLTYTIVFTNNGNATASHFVIVEEYPDSRDCFDDSDLPVWWQVSELVPGETDFITVPGAVLTTCPISTVLYNTVFAIVSESVVSDTALTHITHGPYTDTWQLHLEPSKNNPDLIFPQKQTEYHFTLQSTGNQTVTNIHFTASNTRNWPPEHFTVFPTITHYLEPGDSLQISIVGTAPADVVSGTSNALLLTAVGLANGEPSVIDNTSTTITVGWHFDVQTESFVERTFAPQTPLTFTRHITNSGNFTANLCLTSEILIPVSGWAITWQPNPIPKLGPQQDYNVVAIVNYPGQERAEAIVHTGIILCEDSRYDRWAIDHLKVEEPQVGDIDLATLEGSAPEYIWPHQQTSYRFILTNTGNQIVTDIHLTVSNTAGWPNELFTVFPQDIDELQPGATRQISVTGTSPPCFRNSTPNTLFLFADGEPSVTDVTSMTVVVGYYISAQIEPGAQHTIMTQETLTFSRQITNIGTAESTFSITNETPLPDGWNVSWSPNPIPPLEPCGSYNSVASVNSPPTVEDISATITTTIVSLENPDESLAISIDFIQIKPYRVYLPLFLRPWKLHFIDNPDINGDYQVCWDIVSGADSYVLEEAASGLFRDGDLSWAEVCSVQVNCCYIEGKEPARYHYRVKAYSSEVCSGLSDVKWVDAWGEQEPNSPGAKANGPLVSDRYYYGLPDLEDYFKFEASTEGIITVNLNNYKEQEGQLYLFYQQVAYPEADKCDIPHGVDGCTIVYDGKAGQYIILVYTSLGQSTVVSYTLNAEFP